MVTCCKIFGQYAELFVKTVGKVGWIIEPDYVTYFIDSIMPL